MKRRLFLLSAALSALLPSTLFSVFSKRRYVVVRKLSDIKPGMFMQTGSNKWTFVREVIDGEPFQNHDGYVTHIPNKSRNKWFVESSTNPGVLLPCFFDRGLRGLKGTKFYI